MFAVNFWLFLLLCVYKISSSMTPVIYISWLKFSFKYRGYRTCWKSICVITRLEPKGSLLRGVFLYDSPISFFQRTQNMLHDLVFVFFHSQNLLDPWIVAFPAVWNLRALYFTNSVSMTCFRIARCDSNCILFISMND